MSIRRALTVIIPLLLLLVARCVPAELEPRSTPAPLTMTPVPPTTAAAPESAPTTAPDGETSPAATPLSSTDAVISRTVTDATALAMISVGTADQVERLSTFRGHSARVTAVTFSPAGTLLASGGYDNLVYLCEIPR